MLVAIKFVWIVSTLAFSWLAISADFRLDTNDGASLHDMTYGDLFFEIVYPENLRYTYRMRPAKDFGVAFNCTHNKIPLVPADPLTGCGSPQNAALIKGNIALVSRGDCSFLSKAIQAERAGAVGVIVMDDDMLHEDLYIDMVVDGTSRNVQIPAGFLLGKNGYAILNELRDLHLPYALVNIPVNVTNAPGKLLQQPPWVLWS